MTLFSDRIAEMSYLHGQFWSLSDPGEKISWTELERHSRAIAHGLADRGMGVGDKVAILAPNSARHAEAVVAILRSGCCLVPLSSFLEPLALSKILRDCETRVVFTTSALREKLETALALLGAPDVAIIGLDTPEYDAIRRHTPTGAAKLPTVDARDAAIIIYSSGTTGLPKGIVHEHGLRARQTEGFAAIGFAAGEATILSTPLSSNWTLTGLLATLWAGGHTIIVPKFDARDYLAQCVAWQPRYAFLVPTQIERLLLCPELDDPELGLRTIKLSAGSPLRPAHKRAFADRWKGGLVEIYGMTEGSVTTSLDVDAYPHKLESVGRPSPGIRVAILSDDGAELPVGEIGEIAGHSPYMMSGYYRREEATSDLLWRARDGTLFQRTGDLGKLDRDGFLYICGRAKDMIISGGQNVFPGDIEEVLAGHVGVAEAAVIGVPSERWGETPFAVIVPKNPDLPKEDLLDWANERLGKHQRISNIAFVDQLPRGSLDKVSKKDLRARFARQPEE